MMELSLGSPPQTVWSLVDTGSSDLWVHSPGSCERLPERCSISGSFVASKSSSYRYLDSNFTIRYVSNDTASGDYSTDVFRFGDFSVQNMEFAVVYNTSSSVSVLGIGFPSREVAADSSKAEQYSNLPVRLREDGITASSAYSIYLDTDDTGRGSIVFGGLDLAKFCGELITVPIPRVDDDQAQYTTVTVHGFEFDGQKIGKPGNVDCIFDTGAGLSFLPDDVMQALYDSLHVDEESRHPIAPVPCTLRDSKQRLTINFANDLAISFPMNALVLFTTGSPDATKPHQ